MFAVGSIFSTASIFLGRMWIFAIFCTLIVFIAVMFGLSFLKKDVFFWFKNFFGIKNLKIFCLSILISSFIFGCFTAVNFSLHSKREFDNSMHSICAVVSEVVKNDSMQDVVLRNVVIDGTKQNFKIKATCETAIATLIVGDKVDFNAYLFANKLVRNGDVSTSSLKNNIQYYCTILDGILVSQSRASIVDYIKDDVKNLYLNGFENKETAGLCYAILMGDKSMLSDEYYEIFQNAGIAHVLAVSGLHVGFLVAIILFLTKLLKINPKVRFFVIFAILILYNILCGFAPSVFRASVMSLCLMLGLIIGERNDSLSNLSLAGIIVLLVQPLNLFDVGFLLSFSSVFGILFFQKPISNLLCKLHINKFVSEPISLTVAATIGTLPWTCKYFGYLSPISILSNLIVLPLFCLAYYVLIPSTLIALIFGAKILVVANFAFNIVISLSAVFAKVGVINMIYFDTIDAILFYFLVLFVSPYFMLNLKRKAICAFAFILAFSPVMIVTNSETRFDYYSVSVCERANDTALLTTENNQKVLLNVGKSSSGLYNLKTLLRKRKIKNLDILILANYTASYCKNLIEIVQKYHVKQVVLLGNVESGEKKQIENACKNCDLTFENSDEFDLTANIHICTYFDANKYKAIIFQFDEKNFLFMLGAVSADILSSSAIFDQTFDLVVINNVYDLRYENLNCEKTLAFGSTICAENFCLIDDLWTIKF